jgi:hypothetical protein
MSHITLQDLENARDAIIAGQKVDDTLALFVAAANTNHDKETTNHELSIFFEFVNEPKISDPEFHHPVLDERETATAREMINKLIKDGVYDLTPPIMDTGAPDPVLLTRDEMDLFLEQFGKN